MILLFRAYAAVLAAVFAAIILTSCNVNAVGNKSAERNREDEQRKAIEALARRDDPLAMIALDRSIAHVTRTFEHNIDRVEYWFDPRTKRLLIHETGHRAAASTSVFERTKTGVVVRIMYGGQSNGKLINVRRIEIDKPVIERLKKQYTFDVIDVALQDPDAFVKLPTLFYADSNREFLSYFTDPTYIGGRSSDYIYSKQKPTKVGGRDAYLVTVKASEAYKRSHADTSSDEIGDSKITLLIDKQTGLPLEARKGLKNSNFLYGEKAVLDPTIIDQLPQLPFQNQKAPTFYWRLVTPSSLARYGFVPLGNTFDGLRCEAASLSSTDTAHWQADIIYTENGKDGIYISEADAARAPMLEQEIQRHIDGVSEEKTLTDRSNGGLIGADVHKDPIPKPKIKNIRIHGAEATLYSYVGQVALKMTIGDKLVFIRDYDEYRHSFALTRDKALQIAERLLASSNR